MSEFGRMLDEAQERIQALEQQNAGLERERDALKTGLGHLRLNAVQLGDFMYGAVRECSADMIRIIDAVLDPGYVLELQDRSHDVQKLVDAARTLHKLLAEEHLYWYAGDNRRFSEEMSAKNAALAEALKPFEQEPAPQEGKG